MLLEMHRETQSQCNSKLNADTVPELRCPPRSCSHNRWPFCRRWFQFWTVRVLQQIWEAIADGFRWAWRKCSAIIRFCTPMGRGMLIVGLWNLSSLWYISVFVYLEVDDSSSAIWLSIVVQKSKVACVGSLCQETKLLLNTLKLRGYQSPRFQTGDQ